MTALTIDVKDLVCGDGESLGDAIVQEAARQLIDGLHRDLSTEIKTIARETAEKAIRERVAEVLSDIMDQPLFQTDEFGNRKKGSEPKTIHEIIIDRAHAYLNEKVDEHGRSVGSYGNGASRIAWLASKSAESMLKDDFKKEIDEAGKMLRASLQGKLSQAFQSAFIAAVK